MRLKISDNIPAYIKFLKKRHGALQEVCAETVNEAARRIDADYRAEVKKFTLRNKFTLGAIKLLPATAKRSTGEYRKMEKINAVIGVKKLKGGKEHYLRKQEEGATVKGNANTLGAVPVPLNTARMSGAHNRPVKGPLRLQTTTTQTLTLGGQPFGTKADRFNPRQRWALLYKYTGRSGSGKPRGREQGWDIKKPFFFQGLTRGLGIFQLQGSRFRMIRTLENKSIAIRARHGLGRVTRKMSSGIMEMLFRRAALKRQ